MVQLNRIPVLFLFVNPAPLWREDQAGGEPEPKAHRDNTAWYVSIPALGVTVQACDDDGEPIVGYWGWRSCSNWAMGLWNAIQADPKLLVQLRETPEAPLTIDEDDPKIMHKVLMVPSSN